MFMSMHAPLPLDVLRDPSLPGSLHLSLRIRHQDRLHEALHGAASPPLPPRPEHQPYWIGPEDGWACATCGELIRPVSDDPERHEQCPACGTPVDPVNDHVPRDNTEFQINQLRPAVETNQQVLAGLETDATAWRDRKPVGADT